MTHGLFHNTGMTPHHLLASRTGRLFLALWPEAAVQRQLLDHVNRWTWPPQAARYATTDWHVTLHFIGSVDETRCEEIAHKALVPFVPFRLVLDQPAVWQRGLAVLCVGEVPLQLRALWEQLGNRLQQVGCAPDPRPYLPHVTLARHAKGATPPTTIAPIEWQVGRYVLAVSTGDSGQRYRVIREYCG